jgi:hypothetical protein
MNDLRDFKKQDVIDQLNAAMVKHHFPEIDTIKFDDCKNLFAQDQFKVTGVQNQLPEVKQFCRRVYAEMGILLNCTLHLLPPLDSDELNYRPHFQHLFVYQISGTSKWRFPVIDGNPYRESSNRAKPASKLKLSDMQVLEKVISTDEALFIPYAISCTVSAETNTPCLYLTFAEEEINVRDVLNFLSEEFLGVRDFEARFFEGFDQDEFLQKVPPTDAEAAIRKVDDFYTKAKMAKFKHPHSK